jgi:hypothetical protein
MKVLQLRDLEGDTPLALHSQVTVVRVQDPVRRAWLIGALSQLPCGGDIGAEGTVEVHGIRFDVDAGSLALLGLDTDVAPVVTAADLPGHDGELETARWAKADAQVRRKQVSADLDALRSDLADLIIQRDAARDAIDELQRGEGPAREALAAAGAERSRMEFELQAARDERSRAERELSQAVLARDSLTSEYEKLQARLDAARTRHRAAMDQAIAAAAAREAEHAHRPTADDDPAASRAAAEVRLSDAERLAAEADPYRDDSPLSRQIEVLERRRVELVQRRVALGDSASVRVSSALDEVLAPTRTGTPIVAALALADTWRDLHQQIGALDAGVSPAERHAEERVHAARRAVAEAEAQFNQPVLTPEQIAKVEQAHAAVLEAQDRMEARFGRGRSQKRLEELRADERRVLERLGFSTYADYMMSSSSRGVGQANRSIAESVRAQLADAQAALDAIPGAADRARRRGELLRRKEDVAPKIAELLGHEPTGPEAEDELRSLREGDADRSGGLRDLGAALTSAGIDVGPEPWDQDDLVLLARAFIAEDQAAEREREDASGAVTALEVRVKDLRDARQRGEQDERDVSDLPATALVAPRELADDSADQERKDRWAEVDAARTALAEAVAAEARHAEWRDRVDEVEQQLAEATQGEADAAAVMGVAESEMRQDFPERIEEAGHAVDDSEAALARARGAEDDLGRRFTDKSSSTGVEVLVTEAETVLAEREAAVADAAEREQQTAADLVDTEAQFVAADEALRTLSLAAAQVDTKALIDELDWALLARLAQVRSVGLAGAVPLVLDDPFSVVPDDEVGGVLDRLIRMASAVQVVVVSDRPAIRVWADSLGAEHAATVML